jgi:hypothetical protein
MHRATRAQARLGARLEAMEAKLEGGFADLRSTLAAARPPAGEASLPFAELFDAADILEEAARQLVARGEEELAAGVLGVVKRLELFVGRAGYVRVATASEPPDGRLFRLVAAAGGGSGGGTPRVVRAAVRQGDAIVREGELIIQRGQVIP